MSKQPVHAVNRYKADLREISFLLYEQFKLQELLGHAPFEDWSRELVDTTLSETYKLATEVLGPLNAVGDEEGAQLVEGRVKTPSGFKEAWKKLFEAGYLAVGAEPEFGGGGSPKVVQALVVELLNGANTAFAIYPGLGLGVGELIAALGTDEQKQRWIPNLIGGKWGGTMCLTEPQAGSDVGAARTRARDLGDGTWSISGTKMFISGGDHDMADNIIHLVLARVDGAPAGTKGLTLFIVPSRRVNADGSLGEDNDVTVGRIEHKMGINGSATCVLNFGENDKCVGVPVGGPAQLNRGMMQMFHMMNGARISTGLQGIGVASSAFLNALDYAKERKQGASIKNWKDASAPRVPIIEHPDVRRMLLDMKSRVEGIRALAVKLSLHGDRVHALTGKDDAAAQYHQGQLDLLVPLVKAYGSDQAFRVCETAIQTFGGAGYTKDHPVEQYCRDAKIFSIYEGTNHIQAMDLVGRKLGQNGGNNMRAYLGDVGKFVAQHSAHPKLGAEVKTLGEALEALTGTTMRFMQWFGGGELALVPLVANRFLEMMAEATVGWLLLEGAAIADAKLAELPADHNDRAFYQGKIAAAQYFARNVLPGVAHKAQAIAKEDRSALEIPDAAFATV